MSIITRARLLRRKIETMATDLTDTDALEVPELFPKWSGESLDYTVGDRVRYDELLYKCLTAHTSQPTWTPDNSPSLWVRVDDPSQEWPEWVQPTGSTDAYMTGDKVSHDSKHWISTMDFNVYEPSVYGWNEVIS